MTSRDSIIDKIRKCSSLPSLPTVVLDVLRVARSDRADLQEIAELIGNDPALTSKVIKTVNSSFYGLGKPVTTLSKALVILGTETVKMLVLGFSLPGKLQGDSAQATTQMAYWRRSIYSAVTARLLAQRIQPTESEEVFLAALLRDIGIQVLKQVVGDPFEQLLGALEFWDGRLVRRSRALLGVSHCEAGLILAEHWNLPPIIRQVIRWHHMPGRAEPSFRTACRLVRLADLCAEVFMSHGDNGCVRRVQRYARAALAMSPDACDSLLAEAAVNTNEMASLFEVDIGEQLSYEEILARANETLQSLSLEAHIKARQLQARAETDPLTGLANRGKLDQALAEEFAQAVRLLQPLAVVFMDIDHFKRINDAHGHVVGDEALKHLAATLRGLARPMDTLGRYGGEEFLLVLPRTSLASAAAIAEHIRAEVQARPFMLPSGPVAMTISIGVAGFDGEPGPYKIAGTLVRAADRATYAAKAAGRNTVRVFSPKPKKPAPT